MKILLSTVLCVVEISTSSPFHPFFTTVFQIVVMACKVVEMAKPKCERYWPEVNQSMKIGAIKVTTVSGRRREGGKGGRERERERDSQL